MRPPDDACVAPWQSLPASSQLYRSHDENYAGNEFSPCKGIPSRFAPLRRETEECIPTSYAATTLDGAAFETVFRGIPHKYESVVRARRRLGSPKKIKQALFWVYPNVEKVELNTLNAIPQLFKGRRDVAEVPAFPAVPRTARQHGPRRQVRPRCGACEAS